MSNLCEMYSDGPSCIWNPHSLREILVDLWSDMYGKGRWSLFLGTVMGLGVGLLTGQLGGTSRRLGVPGAPGGRVGLVVISRGPCNSAVLFFFCFRFWQWRNIYSTAPTGVRAAFSIKFSALGGFALNCDPNQVYGSTPDLAISVRRN